MKKYLVITTVGVIVMKKLDYCVVTTVGIIVMKKLDYCVIATVKCYFDEKASIQ